MPDMEDHNSLQTIDRSAFWNSSKVICAALRAEAISSEGSDFIRLAFAALRMVLTPEWIVAGVAPSLL